jgi:CRP/FNR family transcriptional regulator/CRP/FNR family cyclic AMP-dependent transcriptional regulator
MTHIELLQGTELFAKLSAEELTAVARCVVERQAEAGELLIKEGQPGEALFLIESGKVVVEKSVRDKKVQLATLGPGAVFGEMSLIDSFWTSASVTTTAPTRLLVLGRLDLNVLLTWDTLLASKMWRSFTEMLCHRLRATNEKLFERLGEDAPRDLLAHTADLEAR